MKISSKITLSFAVVLALIVVLGLFALIRMDKVNQASTDIAEIYLPSTVGVLRIQIDSSDFRRSEMQHILSPDRAAQQRYETKMSESKKQVESSFELVRKLLSTDEERTQFEKITNNWNSYLQESDKIIALSRENKNDEAIALLRGDSKKYFDAMDEALKVMEKSNTDETNEASAQGDELYASSRLWVIILIIGTLIISSFAGILTYRAISVPLGRLQSTMQEIVRDNNMTLTVRVENRDEIGITAEAFNTMMGKLRDTLQGINGSTTQLAAAAEELAAVTQETTDGVLRQQQETDQVATAMNEMSATVQEVSQNAVKAAEMAHNADDEANRGRKVVTDAVNGIQKLAAEVERSAETINRLQAETASIGSVLDVIQAITEQTNLLALNAAIEAARAGEHGRGFAVVADEVRTLAQRTQESTKEIQSKIERLQIASREAVSAMESGRQQATTSVSLVQSAGSALSAITSSVASINDMNALIASAAEEQSSVANEIDRNITNIARVSDETANGAQQTSATSEELAQLAAELQRMVNQFRLA